MSKAIKSLSEIYLSDVDEYFISKRIEKIGYFSGLLAIITIFYLVIFPVIILSLHKEIILSNKLLTIIPIEYLLFNEKLKMAYNLANINKQ